jgi:hypothetical protein
MTSSGIEPATFRLLAEYLYQLHYHVPQQKTSVPQPNALPRASTKDLSTSTNCTTTCPNKRPQYLNELHYRMPQQKTSVPQPTALPRTPTKDLSTSTNCTTTCPNKRPQYLYQLHYRVPQQKTSVPLPTALPRAPNKRPQYLYQLHYRMPPTKDLSTSTNCTTACLNKRPHVSIIDLCTDYCSFKATRIVLAEVTTNWASPYVGAIDCPPQEDANELIWMNCNSLWVYYCSPSLRSKCMALWSIFCKLLLPKQIKFHAAKYRAFSALIAMRSLPDMRCCNSIRHFANLLLEHCKVHTDSLVNSIWTSCNCVWY